MTAKFIVKYCVAALCLALTLNSFLPAVYAKSLEDDRRPPRVSHKQTLDLFEQGNYPKAFKAALHRFEWGDDDLHGIIGLMYRNGWGTSRHLQKARAHLKLAAQRGNKAAQYQYAEMLRLGEGGNIDTATACQLYVKGSHYSTAMGFQAALCALKSGNSNEGLKRLHQVALSQHSAATKRLLNHYRQNKPDNPNSSVDYRRALLLWAENDFAGAQKLAQKAIRADDYRAYAVLGESQRSSKPASNDLMQNQVEIGQLFGSALPQYATGQRLQAQGHGAAACKFFLLSYQQGLPLAGVELAQCLSAGHLEKQRDGSTRCDYLSSAFEAGYRQSAGLWMQCQIESKGTPATLAQAYARTKALDASFQNLPLAHELCEGLPIHSLAQGTQITLHNGIRQLISSPAIEVCELQQDGSAILAFAPQTEWLTTLTRYELSLPVVRHGLQLEGLSRHRLRKQLKNDRSALMPLELTPQRDRLRPKSTGSIEIGVDYSNDGEVMRMVETCKRCSNDNFLQRARKLSEQLGEALHKTGPSSLSSRNWQIQNWDIQLILEQQEQEMRQVFTRRKRN